jgi:HK97 family phage major capsid protein
MKYMRIIAAALEHPWAVTDEVYHSILSVLVRCEAGERFTAQQIREVVGEKKERVLPYLVSVDGSRLEWDALGGGPLMAKGAGGKAAKPGSVAVLPVYGIIAQRVSQLDISEGGTGIDALTAQFRAALADPNVNAIVLDIDSPGGSVYGVDELAQEVFAAREQKKVVAQVNSLSASAAYYLASQATEIAMTPGGEVGSIGVRSMHTDISQMLAQKGIKVTPITFGKYKAEGNPYEPLSQEARDFMQGRVNDYGEAFVSAVARGRAAKPSAVREDFGQGRMFGAKQAKSLGMVDRIATMDETLARLGVSPAAATSAQASAQITSQLPAAQAAEIAATAEPTKEVRMDPIIEANGAAAAAAAVTQERERVAQITRLATIHKMPAKLSAWITGGTSFEAVSKEIMTALEAGAVPIAVPEAGLSRVEIVSDELDKIEKDPQTKGARWGRAVRCSAMALKRGSHPAKIARDVMHDGKLSQSFEAVATDPQNASSFTEGGFIIPPNLASDYIELLRPLAVVRSLNPTLAPLVNGTLSIPKITSGTSFNYVGETKKIPVSNLKGGVVRASAKKNAGLVPISNDLLRFASIQADTMVRDDMLRAEAQTEDIAFIRNPGSQFSPKGLKYWAGVTIHSALTQAEIGSYTDLQTLKAVQADIAQVQLAMRRSNRPPVRPGWIMSPRSEYFLKWQVRDGIGNNVFRAEMELADPRFAGWPYRVTTQIPENLTLGTGSIASEIYAAEFADVIIADAPTIAIEMSNEASYDDGTGTMISAFQNDQMLIRMIVEHDLIVRHQETVIVMDTVEYGT